MCAASDTPPKSREPSRLIYGTCWLTGTITVFSLVPTLGLFIPAWQRLVLWSAEASIWLPLGQLIGMSGLLLVLRVPHGCRAWFQFATLNAGCLLAAALCGLRLWEEMISLLLNIVIRWGVLLAWIYSVAGFPIVVVMISRARPGQRFERRPVRLWFGITLMLLVAEPFAWWLEQPRERFVLPESLPSAPSDQIRIVAIGSSTMAGHPYEPKFGIPQMLAWRVQAMYPDHKVIWENLAVPGQCVREAIFCLRRLTLRPHLILLYGGHNEFLHEIEEFVNIGSGPDDLVEPLLVNSPLARWLHCRLMRLSVMRTSFTARLALIDRHVVPPMVAPLRKRRFEQELTQLAEYAQRQKIPMLWYVPAGSESGFEPSRSWVSPGTSASAQQELTQLWGAIMESMRQENWTTAADRCREGLIEQPQFAEFHFRLGECLQQLGLNQEAQRHFAQALDSDGYPVRLPHDYQQVVQAVADRFGIATVNGESELRPFTSRGILDRSVIYDNVHPTMRGFFLLGLAGATTVFEKKLLAAEFGVPRAMLEVTQADAAREFEITAADVAVAQRRIANGLRWLSLLRFDEGRRMQEADRWEELSRLIEAGEAQPGERGIEPLDGD